MPISEGNESDVMTFLVIGNILKYKILFLKKKKRSCIQINLLTNLGVPLSRLCVCVCLKEREKRREGEESGKRIDGRFGVIFQISY